ncbi:MAG: hypothetical protein B7733_11840 [Myxococcales bacterium FL481]|nr:MAG: hypothetical protein B7733_11840 [Myxococcales bacterium FL481]
MTSTKRRSPNSVGYVDVTLRDGSDTLRLGIPPRRLDDGALVPPQFAEPRLGPLPQRARLEFERYFSGAENERQLRQLLSERLPGRVRDLSPAEVRDAVLAELNAERFVAQRRQRPSYVGLIHEASPPRSTTADSPGRGVTRDDPTSAGGMNDAWLEVRLVGSDGAPVSGARYVVVTSEGEEIHGTLDEGGSARVNGIPRGPGRVCFPDVDGGDWKRAGPTVADEPALE